MGFAKTVFPGGLRPPYILTYCIHTPITRYFLLSLMVQKSTVPLVNIGVNKKNVKRFGIVDYLFLLCGVLTGKNIGIRHF